MFNANADKRHCSCMFAMPLYMSSPYCIVATYIDITNPDMANMFLQEFAETGAETGGRWYCLITGMI